MKRGLSLTANLILLGLAATLIVHVIIAYREVGVVILVSSPLEMAVDVLLLAGTGLLGLVNIIIALRGGKHDKR